MYKEYDILLLRDHSIVMVGYISSVNYLRCSIITQGRLQDVIDVHLSTVKSLICNLNDIKHKALGQKECRLMVSEQLPSNQIRSLESFLSNYSNCFIRVESIPVKQNPYPPSYPWLSGMSDYYRNEMKKGVIPDTDDRYMSGLDLHKEQHKRLMSYSAGIDPYKRIEPPTYPPTYSAAEIKKSKFAVTIDKEVKNLKF